MGHAKDNQDKLWNICQAIFRSDNYMHGRLYKTFYANASIFLETNRIETNDLALSKSAKEIANSKINLTCQLKTMMLVCQRSF